MKTYPSIQYYNSIQFGTNCIAFNKLDGSNLRVEWNRKRGFYKFGTKTQMINDKDPNFGDAIPIFLEKYGYELERVFRKIYSNVENVVVFCEYLGENSFAGQHLKEDKKDIILFDVNLYKKGFISPKDFINNFGHLHIPDIIYHGEYNDKLIEDVKNNIWNLKEGVICKGIRKTKGNEIVWMAKIKTLDWLNKVKLIHGDKALISELNGDISLI